MKDGENKVVTQYDVAKEAGVTRSMVSYVINGNASRSVAPETKKKILAAIEKLGYRPNKAARALQIGEENLAARRIGVVLPCAGMFRRPYYAEIIEEIYLTAHENGYEVSFLRLFDELKSPVLFNELISEREIGGVILVSIDQAMRSDEDKALLNQIFSRIPYSVCVDWSCKDVCSVSFDKKAAALQATEYGYSKVLQAVSTSGGNISVAYVGEKDERLDGVKAFCSIHCVPFANVTVCGAFDMSGGTEAALSLVKSSKKPQLVVCGSDEVAIGVMRVLDCGAGKTLVVSIDDTELSAFMRPSLTSVHVKKAEMGRRAVDLIVGGQAGQGENAVQEMLPTAIVCRESC